ncbi:phenylacetate--CoA ligase family protein [Pseudoruegeria sp. SK021]|uniref:phenylacetate--CoA ligase family protein n=1 Tax=Pseudoruegeria sp. SK021 TaxID=1933035 RepID=UPI001F0A8D97|nr:phenylacetate--CoA ligase family protein [Pseudoruegeria sp. SK021]
MFEALPLQIAAAQALPGYAEALSRVDPATITTRDALAQLPVLRRTVLRASQLADPPFGGFAAAPDPMLDYILRAPGPIYGQGQSDQDWSRVGNFLAACGVGPGDIVQNCFGYHMSSWGPFFDMASRVVGATVLPAGADGAARQVRAARELGCTVYAGPPKFLSELVQMAEALGVHLPFRCAAVADGVLQPGQRALFAARGIRCQQGFVMPELGCVAYETAPANGMTVDAGVIVEIVTAGTGTPVPEGEIGEVLVTTLNPLAPLIRFATGELSRAIPTTASTTDANPRIAGRCGRADQMTRINDLFIRPEQVAELMTRHPEILRARLVVTRADAVDVVTCLIEVSGSPSGQYSASVAEILKVRPIIQLVPPGSLPRDGKVIDDQRVSTPVTPRCRHAPEPH